MKYQLIISLLMLTVYRVQCNLSVNDQTVRVGESAIFNCTFDSSVYTSPYTIRWFQQRTKVPESDEVKLAFYSSDNPLDSYAVNGMGVELLTENGYAGNIKITTTTVEDNVNRPIIGCEIVAGQHTGTTEGTLLVYKYPESAPNVELFSSDAVFDISDGPTLIAECKSDYGYPLPRVYFTKIDNDGEAIEMAEDDLGGFNDIGLSDLSSDGVSLAGSNSLLKILDSSDDQAIFQCVSVVEVEGLEPFEQRTNVTSFRVKHETDMVKISSSPENAKLGSEITITCKANGFPEPTISINGEETTSLTFTVESTSGDSPYTCTAGGLSDSLELDVIYLEVPETEEPEALNIGDTLTLSCTASGNPPPMLSWWKGDTKVSNKGTYEAEAEFQTNGEYVCKAANGFDELDVESTVTVTVNGLELVNTGDETLDVDIDDTQPLKCIVISNPQATITWSSTGDEELGTPTEEYNEVTFEKTSTLNIGPITSDYSENSYTCTAVSGDNEVTKTYSFPAMSQNDVTEKVISAGGSSIAGIIIGILVAILLVVVIVAVLYNKGIICKKTEKGDETAKDITPGDVPNDGNGDVEKGDVEEKEKLMSEQQTGDNGTAAEP